MRTSGRDGDDGGDFAHATPRRLIATRRDHRETVVPVVVIDAP
jgi:hypothetical protein